jgi:hypothetical protein
MPLLAARHKQMGTEVLLHRHLIFNHTTEQLCRSVERFSLHTCACTKRKWTGLLLGYQIIHYFGGFYA